jgi:hypothetical protein
MVGHVGAFRTLCVDSETASLAVRLRAARSVLDWVVDSRRVRTRSTARWSKQGGVDD